MFFSSIRQRGWARWGCAIVLCGVMPVASALDVTISAEYRGGGSGRFENTTPPGGVCRYWPTTCRGATTVDLPITFTKKAVQEAADPRDEFFLQLPGRREVDVYHDETGEPRRMAFEWTLFSVIAKSARLDRNPTYNRILGGCVFGGGSSGSWGDGRARVLWRLSDSITPGACWSRSIYAPAGTVMQADVEELSVGFNLNIPPPYRLKAGKYRGSTTFRIGPGGDFDFGNDVSNLSGDSLTINFELDVQHAFMFEFPPGSDRAVLEPRNGWQAWLAGGKAPQRIYRDLPFRVWSTGPFKVYKLCQHDMGAHCAIRSDEGEQVAVEVAMSLPAGIQHRGQAVERLQLPTGRFAALQFEAAMPTLNRPGQLHFEVGRSDVQAMLKHPGSTYDGQVTVVFDAEL